MTSAKKKWADEELDVDEDAAISGGAFESQKDENGVFTRVNYYKNTKNQMIKVERRIRAHRKVTKVNCAISQRRNLRTFGDDCLAELSVFRAAEEYPIEVPKKAGGLERENDDDYFFQDLPAKATTLKTKFDKFKEAAAKEADGTVTTVEGDREESARKRLEEGDELGAPKKYIPPSLRAGGLERSRQTEQQQKDECTVRVTNLSEEVKEGDLSELFGKVGKVFRVYLAKHKETKNSKGFAFITFHTKKDAEQAIKQLNRHGYDNLLLNVEWAKPSNRDRERDRA